MKITYAIILSLAVLLFSGCGKREASNLTIPVIKFQETDYVKYLDLPDGVYQPDNPDFDIRDPESWTGNMAQYVVHLYSYDVIYQVENVGDYPAFDTEIDIFLEYSDGEEKIKTISLDEVRGKTIRSGLITPHTVNRQLVKVSAEVYWFD